MLGRRTLLHSATAQSLLWSTGLWSWPVQAAGAAFESKTLAQVVKALGAKSLAASNEVRLSTLDYAENGAAVPVDMATRLPGVERMVLFVEKNPTPLIAVFQMSEAVDTALTVHTKMAQTSDVYAVVITTDGRALFAKKEVKVVLGSCGSTSETPDTVDSKRPTEATRIRAQLQGESALVRMRMAHEMESGQRKNAAGKVVPAWHIDQVAVSLNGKPVMTAEWGPGVSKNPYLQLTLKKAKAGDKLTVSWHDNKASFRTDDMLLV
jgi:sulfur-oxidizing protein SoxY